MIAGAVIAALLVGFVVGWVVRDLVGVPKELGGFGETPAGWALMGQSSTTVTYRVDPSTAHEPLYFDFGPAPAWTGEPTEYRFSWPEVKT